MWETGGRNKQKSLRYRSHSVHMAHGTMNAKHWGAPVCRALMITAVMVLAVIPQPP